MEPWRYVWRRGIVPQLTLPELVALREALQKDDPSLLQAATTSPPPLQSVQEWPCEAACPLGYAGWRGEGLETVRDVEEHFARLCFDCDQALGEPAGVRGFLDWWDGTPRPEAVRELLTEVELALAGKEDEIPQ